MIDLEKLDGFNESEVIVIPIIDVSGSMDGDRIAAVNEAMAAVPAQLAQINDDTVDGKLLIAPMSFSTGASWFGLSNGQPAEVETFRWIDKKASGLTDLGAACDLLYEKLTVKEKGGWMNGRSGAKPVIILISDGGPTDDYKSSLDKLKNRGWFRAAFKFAIAVGTDANRSVLTEFTGTPEAVFDTEKIRLDLASIVKRVVVSASKTGSRSASVSNVVNISDVVEDTTGKDIEDQAQKEAINNINTTLNINDSDDLF